MVELWKSKRFIRQIVEVNAHIKSFDFEFALHKFHLNEMSADADAHNATCTMHNTRCTYNSYTFTMTIGGALEEQRWTMFTGGRVTEIYTETSIGTVFRILSGRILCIQVFVLCILSSRFHRSTFRGYLSFQFEVCTFHVNDPDSCLDCVPRTMK